MACSPHSHECYFDFERPGEDWTIAPGERLTMYTPNEAVRQGNGVLADWSGKMEFYPNHTEDKGSFGLRLAEGCEDFLPFLPTNGWVFPIEKPLKVLSVFGRGAESHRGSIPSAFCNDRDFCPPYQGLNGVATAVEFTLVPHGPDFYDVSVINGFNVPIEMKPNGQFARVTEEAAGSHKGYSCGAAGAFRQEDGRLSSCNSARLIFMKAALRTECTGGNQRASVQVVLLPTGLTWKKCRVGCVARLHGCQGRASVICLERGPHELSLVRSVGLPAGCPRWLRPGAFAETSRWQRRAVQFLRRVRGERRVRAGGRARGESCHSAPPADH